jgi:large subunit ribosomal protein L10e
MARIRKFVAYRRLERPYTRVSKYRKKAFIRGSPNIHIVKFDLGNAAKDFKYKVNLISTTDLNIRHNALESARMTSNKVLETKLGKNAYHMRVKVYPHHVLRENPLAAGAGADRMSTGMSHSFGKPISAAARVFKGQTIFSIGVDKQNLATAKAALKRASYKMPCKCTIQVEESA